MPSGDQRAMPRKTINDKSDLVARKNSSEPKKTASSLFVALRWIIVALEGWMTLLGAYFVQNQLDTILLELRTRLWDNQDDAIYFDKWDFVHWGSAVVAVAMWPDRKFQRVIMKLGLIVILGFEVIEQILVCEGMTHAGSCEPWQDTTKDCFTGTFGLLVGFYFPQLIQSLSPPEMVAWTFATVLFLPQWWWFGIPIKVLECFISLKLKNNAAALRLFFVVELATLLYIRYILDTLTWDLIRESFWVCLGLQVVMHSVIWLDRKSRKLVE